MWISNAIAQYDQNSIKVNHFCNRNFTLIKIQWHLSTLSESVRTLKVCHKKIWNSWSSTCRLNEQNVLNEGAQVDLNVECTDNMPNADPFLFE